ncbi:MAG: NYN domain-containing protein [Selenomonas ruminantium]|jgi:site-specific DNA-cytosine methylase|uniref:NYN domain-containing protein n=1 Tax=Selenomonas ruminantium TaxID=971 RepID=A0A927ZTU6_SELRU|nr:NYN domain-containing protein [Selenomonas ruminantium]MBE6083925.1 NYN domain-containing protein [Selenomonas ruminantium]
MTLDSSNEVVAILYDIENAPFEMLNYTLGKARRYQPCRTIVVSDWEARPEQKRWEKLMRRPGFTFRQISRTYQGKNSLDSAIYDSAKLLYDEGVRRFFIITTDSDFVRIAEYLNSDTPSYIIGVGTKQASETLRNAYDEFFVYPPEEKEKKTARKTKTAAAKESEAKQEKTAKAAVKESKTVKPAKTTKTAKAAKTDKAAKPAKSAKAARTAKKQSPVVNLPEGTLTVNLPRTLRQSLEERQTAEGVSMDELVTYLLMRGMARWVED